jgi:hypothetical protein
VEILIEIGLVVTVPTATGTALDWGAWADCASLEHEESAAAVASEHAKTMAPQTRCIALAGLLRPRTA